MMDQYILPKIYISNSYNPAFNLAFEEYLVNTSNNDDLILYLWQNENTVVIGRNQNPWKECNWKTLNNDEGKMVRRLSGGGAVYHDLGNLNFTFISKDSENKVLENVNIIVDALKNLGIDAYFSGKNDILVDGYKVSGNAYFTENDILCHHGTLLVNANINKLASYLKVSSLKLKSKGIDSVKSRVINLKEINNDLTVSNIRNSLIDSYFSKVGNGEIYYIDENSETKIDDLLQKYNSWSWNFGSSPQFDIQLRRRFNWGEVDLNILVEDGIVENIKVYSDSIDPYFSRNIETVLKGVKFKKKNFLEAANKFEIKIKMDLINWFSETDF